MKKGTKIILGILITLLIIGLVVVGIAIWVGKSLISNFNTEEVIDEVRKVAEEEGVELPNPEELTTNNSDDSKEEGKIIEEIYGITLPEVKMKKVMEKSESDSSGEVMFAFKEEIDLEELKKTYQETLENEGWNLESEVFVEEGYLLDFSNKKDNSSLTVQLSKDGIMIVY